MNEKQIIENFVKAYTEEKCSWQWCYTIDLDDPNHCLHCFTQRYLESRKNEKGEQKQ